MSEKEDLLFEEGLDMLSDLIGAEDKPISQLAAILKTTGLVRQWMDSTDGRAGADFANWYAKNK